jgi:hypothetical protein
MRIVVFFVALVLSTPAAAQDWADRQGDVALSMQEISVLTSGTVLTYYDDGQSSYGADGAYTYTYASGEMASGSFTIKEDGKVCVIFTNGRDRCDRFVSSRGKIILLTAQGHRFPVRP